MYGQRARLSREEVRLRRLADGPGVHLVPWPHHRLRFSEIASRHGQRPPPTIAGLKAIAEEIIEASCLNTEARTVRLQRA